MRNIFLLHLSYCRGSREESEVSFWCRKLVLGGLVGEFLWLSFFRIFFKTTQTFTFDFSRHFFFRKIAIFFFLSTIEENWIRLFIAQLQHRKMLSFQISTDLFFCQSCKIERLNSVIQWGLQKSPKENAFERMSQKQDLGGVRHTAVYKGNLLLARHEPEIDFASSIFLEFQAHISSFCSYVFSKAFTFCTK